MRLTPQRDAILEYLESTRSHPTAQEVYEEVKKHFPYVSRATVYNTLGTMTRLGLLVEIKRAEGAVRYETDPTPHANLICLRCGSVEDVPIVAQPVLDLSAAPGFEVVSTSIEVYGYCSRCRQEMEEEE
jgi:Fur family peroxide stress response transcriptional regulator